MVKSKEIQIIQTGNDDLIFYVYELSSTYNGEKAINYFDNQRRKATGNIAEGNYIDRNYDIEKTANIIFNNLETDITLSKLLASYTPSILLSMTNMSQDII